MGQSEVLQCDRQSVCLDEADAQDVGNIATLVNDTTGLTVVEEDDLPEAAMVGFDDEE